MKAKKLVTLWERPSYDGNGFTYYLLYTDENGKRRQKSLGHADGRKAERQRAKFERHLRMGQVEPGSLTLKEKGGIHLTQVSTTSCGFRQQSAGMAMKLL